MEIVTLQELSPDLFEKFMEVSDGEKSILSVLASSQTGNDRVVTDERMEYVKNSADHLMLFCIDDSALIGMALAQRVTGINNAYVYIHDLVVDPSVRSKGTGSKLMQTLMKEGQEKWPEIVRFQLTSRPSRGTGSFFEKCGFRARTKESGDETIVYVKDMEGYTS